MLNNRCAAIRVNLRGREPYGCVEPGPEAAALVEDLRRELHVLRQPGTDEPIVDLVATPEELFGPDPHPDLPDLTVGFRTDLGRLEACASPRVGLVEVPLWNRARAPTGGRSSWGARATTPTRLDCGSVSRAARDATAARPRCSISRPRCSPSSTFLRRRR